MPFELVGIDATIDVCQCCGKRDLSHTVILRAMPSGLLVRYGSVCASRALYGRATQHTARRVEQTAKQPRLF